MGGGGDGFTYCSLSFSYFAHYPIFILSSFFLSVHLFPSHILYSFLSSLPLSASEQTNGQCCHHTTNLIFVILRSHGASVMLSVEVRVANVQIADKL
jgi:hypothetical protein